MRAVLCKELGPPESLVVEEVPEPVVEPDQVLIDVHACGINFPDVLIIQGKYQIRPDLPFSPGAEVAGEVVEVGDEVDDLEVGARVLAPTSFGGLAERVAVDADRVVPIPDEMDFVTGSGFLLVYGTAYHALKQRAELQQGESLLVLGAAGGVGLATVELGSAMGAKVIAGASTEEKLALARAHGAELGINYVEEDLKGRIKELTEGRGVDVVCDPVGGDYTEAALRGTAWKGRLLVIGFAAGKIPELPANLPLLKGCSIVGVFWGSFDRRQPRESRENNRELLAMYVRGEIEPEVSKTYPLERASEALRTLADRKALGKIVVTMR